MCREDQLDQPLQRCLSQSQRSTRNPGRHPGASESKVRRSRANRRRISRNSVRGIAAAASSHNVASFLTGAGINQSQLLTSSRRFQRVVKFAIGQQTGIACDFRPMEFDSKLAVEADPQGVLLPFTQHASLSANLCRMCFKLLVLSPQKAAKNAHGYFVSGKFGFTRPPIPVRALERQTAGSVFRMLFHANGGDAPTPRDITLADGKQAGRVKTMGANAADFNSPNRPATVAHRCRCWSLRYSANSRRRRAAAEAR